MFPRCDHCGWYPFAGLRGSEVAVNPGLEGRDPEGVCRTFEGIAGRYDLANHVLSFGLDWHWRAVAARILAGYGPSRVLDVATGSGDLALAVKRAVGGASVVGMDFCAAMLARAEARGLDGLVEGDALAMPFGDGVFDAVTVAFGLRNMASWDGALREMRRVLVPGGLLLVMDFAFPGGGPLAPAMRLYLRRVMPFLGGLLTGRPGAYAYLASSIETFPRGGAMLALIEDCGFHGAAARFLPPGVAAIYTARAG
jgi:demethylmenaquinone methyltransferase / 2-methoxy-6-polyprenyl-1,4-benzoquinol methylase